MHETVEAGSLYAMPEIGALEHPDAQPYTARLAGAGSLRAELEAVLERAPDEATPADFRRLILDENAARKSTANQRMWAWKRLKLRYLLDRPGTAEFQAFRGSMEASSSPSERGLLCGLMFSRTDRLFREVTLEIVSPRLQEPGQPVDPSEISAAVEVRAATAGLHWSAETYRSITNHFLSALKDFGLLAGSPLRRTVRPSPTPNVTRFAATLARLEGSTDRQILSSRWFRLLGFDEADVAALLREAAAAGLIRFLMQADVVEIDLRATATAGR